MNADLIGLADRVESLFRTPIGKLQEQTAAIATELRALAGAEGGDTVCEVCGYVPRSLGCDDWHERAERHEFDGTYLDVDEEGSVYRWKEGGRVFSVIVSDGVVRFHHTDGRRIVYVGKPIPVTPPPGSGRGGVG